MLQYYIKICCIPSREPVRISKKKKNHFSNVLLLHLSFFLMSKKVPVVLVFDREIVEQPSYLK